MANGAPHAAWGELVQAIKHPGREFRAHQRVRLPLEWPRAGARGRECCGSLALLGSNGCIAFALVRLGEEAMRFRLPGVGLRSYLKLRDRCAQFAVMQ